MSALRGVGGDGYNVIHLSGCLVGFKKILPPPPPFKNPVAPLMEKESGYFLYTIKPAILNSQDVRQGYHTKKVRNNKQQNIVGVFLLLG